MSPYYQKMIVLSFCIQNYFVFFLDVSNACENDMYKNAIYGYQCLQKKCNIENLEFFHTLLYMVELDFNHRFK